MKRLSTLSCQILLGAIFSIALPVNSEGQTAEGIVIFRSSPYSLPESARTEEYTSIQLTPRIVNAQLLDGTIERITSERFEDWLAYQNLQTGSIVTHEDVEKFDATLEKAERLYQSYPSSNPVLSELLPELRNASEKLRQGEILVGGTWKLRDQSESESMPEIKQRDAKEAVTVVFEGRKITGIVTSVYPDSLTLQTGSRVLKIDLSIQSDSVKTAFEFDPARALEYQQQQRARFENARKAKEKERVYQEKLENSTELYVEIIGIIDDGILATFKTGEHSREAILLTMSEDTVDTTGEEYLKRLAPGLVDGDTMDVRGVYQNRTFVYTTASNSRKTVRVMEVLSFSRR